MNVNLIDPYLKSTLKDQLPKIEKGLNKVIVNKEINYIMMLGNGSLDSIIMVIISYNLNHTKTVGMTKPKNKEKYDMIIGPYIKTNKTIYPQGCDLVKIIPTYIKYSNKVALVIDQEYETLDSIFQRIDKNLAAINIKIDSKEKINDKAIHYQCSFASKKLDFILIISGLSELQTKSHKIEDHLIKIATKLNKINPKIIRDSKDIWRSLNDSIKNDVMRHLCHNNDLLIEIFPQHYRGLNLLKQIE